MSEENKIGKKIRQLREDHGLSVEELAESSHNSVETIENIESGALVPSLSPLMKIARSLGVRLGTFMDDAPQSGPFMVKSGKSENIIRFSGQSHISNQSTLELYSLAYGKGDKHMEPFIVDVHPLNGADHQLSSHEGEEFIYILHGEIEIFYGQEKYHLAQGDSIYYDSVIPHDLHAHKSEARILAVIYSPF
jgi:transcriptional regulator with XRE-family HTH domain